MSTTNPKDWDTGDAEPPMAWHKFVKQVGVSTVTAWRWRSRGWIETVTIAGKPYVMASEIRRFNARLVAGEFANLTKEGSKKS
jgi:hypothetical protein